jgi:dTMP kinase
MAELYFRPGSLVVFEGLDRSGKSTQLKRLSMLDWAAPEPIFTHMPSGMTTLTKNIYSLTENKQISSPFARQLLHLACHAENIASIADGRAQHGLVLDRWWWSTVAYGWYAGHLAESGVSASAFFGVIESIWSGQPADMVFLFMTPFESDELNRDEVRSGYVALAEKYASTTVVVPPDDPEITTIFVLKNLRDRGLLR